MNFILGMMKQKTLTVVMAVSTLLAASTVWSLTPGEQRIVDRIKPIGSVCIEGEECVGAATSAVAAVASGPRSGEEIYAASCFACHDTGAAGAPKLGDAAAWTARVDSKGMEMLVANAINGIGAMPAKGACGDCSDEEIAATVEHIIANSK